jgi:hypothetical protein
MLRFTIPVSFVWSLRPLTWREVAMAVDRRWLRPGDAIECAVRRLETTAAPATMEIDLATRRPDEPVFELVHRLAAAEAPQDDDRIAAWWMRVLLRWVYHRRAVVKDPLDLVEEIWCEFGHPAELEPFIRYMPTRNPVAVKGRTVAENLAVLRGEWELYMQALEDAASRDD